MYNGTYWFGFGVKHRTNNSLKPQLGHVFIKFVIFVCDSKKKHFEHLCFFNSIFHCCEYHVHAISASLL